MIPNGKMLVVWSVLILGPIVAEYAKWPASAVTPGSPSESAKLVRGWSNQTRTAQPTDLPSSRGVVPVGGRRDFYVDFTRYGIRPGGHEEPGDRRGMAGVGSGYSGAGGRVL